jgi:hypothetical protein
MTRYATALVYGVLSSLIGFALIFLVIAQGKHAYTAPAAFLIWTAWYASLFMFRCPTCHRSVFANHLPIPTGFLPKQRCTKCGTSLIAKASNMSKGA